MKMIRLLSIGLFALLFLREISAQPVSRDHIEVELISPVETIQPGFPFWVALRMKMEDGWHTYWQNPGDSGMATKITWELPQGAEAGPIFWPYPETISLPPLTSYGYTGEVFLLTQLTIPKDFLGDSVVIKAKADWLVCSDICLPGSAPLEKALKVDPGVFGPHGFWTEKFSGAKEKIPINEEASLWQVEVLDSEKEYIIRAYPRDNNPFYDLQSVSFFPLSSDVIVHAEPQKFIKQDQKYFLHVRKTEGVAIPKTLDGVLISQSGWRGTDSEKAMAFQKPVIQKSGINVMPVPGDSLSMGRAILFAFLGGLILNLMPCVFPVLSLKVMGFVRQAEEEPKKIFMHGISFASGILVSFWILVLVLILLRRGGEELGWGFQLQSPGFVLALLGIFFTLGLSLFGVFEIGMGLAGKAAGLSAGQGLLGSFANGVLATLVATPCTAPLMGASLGFALTQPVYASFVIFTSLGMGLASPYLILAACPGLLRKIPRPGPWMESLKQFMGFLLMVTVVWLLWVLGLQTGLDYVMKVLTGLVALAFSAWIYGRWGGVSRKACIIAIIFFIVVVTFLYRSIPGYTSAQEGHVSTLDTKGILWEKYTPLRLDELRKEGKPVFLDFTAAWCLTCQVNERTVLGSDRVIKIFKDKGVVLLKADWTKRDPEVTRALTAFGRSGVPFYILYPADPLRDPIILSEILTTDIVVDALEKI